MENLSLYKKMAIAGAVAGVCFVLGIFLPYIMDFNYLNIFGKTAAPKISKGEPANILLMGIDARPGEEYNTRTDTMMLACVNPDEKRVAVISIPRDSRVKLSSNETGKINAANVYGGPRAASRAVEKLLGVNVDYYVMVNFNGFASIIDSLGGVTIDVEKRMYKPSEGINLRPGVQHLDGKNALAYVRFRGDTLGDISRTERQQKFMRAVVQQMFDQKTILKMPALLPEIADNVKTDMDLTDMAALAKLAAQFHPKDLIAQTVPGYFYNDPVTGASYWEVDRNKASRLVASLLNGKKIAVVEDTPYSPDAVKQQGVEQKPLVGAETANPEGAAGTGDGSTEGLYTGQGPDGNWDSNGLPLNGAAVDSSAADSQQPVAPPGTDSTTLTTPDSQTWNQPTPPAVPNQNGTTVPAQVPIVSGAVYTGQTT